MESRSNLRLWAVPFFSIAICAGAKPTTAAETRGTAVTAPADEEAEKPKKKVDFEWVAFPDAAKFKVLGLPWFDENQPKMWRMPKSKFEALPSGVKRQSREPAGGRILIRCNTSKLGIKVKAQTKGSNKGFDVYINGKFLRSAVVEEPGQETDLVLFTDLDRQQKEILVYLPHHQEIVISAVGADKDTQFERPEHKFAQPLPIVFYGSSVCQGSGAAKPGMSYEAILCRQLNVDFINLGFGGAGKAEPIVVDLVNSLPACCYIFDLGKSYGMQDKTAYKQMLETVRRAHPDVPLICLTPITSTLEVHSESYSQKSVHTRTVMREAVNELIKAGDKKLILLEGTDLLGFSEHDGLSKDGVHPSDHGYALIAGKLLPVVEKVLGKDDRHSGAGRIYDSAHHFSIVPPAGWNPQPAAAGCFVIASGPVENGFAVNMNVNVNPGTGTPEQTLPATKQMLQKLLNEYQPTEEGFLSLDGKKASCLSGKYKYGQLNLQNLQYQIFSSGKVYTITFSSPQESFPKWRALFEQSARTARVE